MSDCLAMPNYFIYQYLTQFFDFHAKKINCQVATQIDNIPHIRTMNLRHVTHDGQLILLTDTQTRKWQEFKKSPRIAICLYEHPRQVIIEGEVQLNTVLTNSELVRFYWEHYLDQYWRNYYLSQNAGSQADDISTVFGVITLMPDFFEILEINENDYLKSLRKQFHRNKKAWLESNIPPV